MKTSKILFTLSTLILALFFILAFFSPKKIVLNREITTEIPIPVAFRQFMYSQTGKFPENVKNQDTLKIDLVYFKKPKPYRLKQEMDIDYLNFSAKILPVSQSNLSPFSGIRHTIRLKKLADGSTSITWELHYSIAGLTPRLLNRFIWKHRMQQFLDRKMKQIENSLTL